MKLLFDENLSPRLIRLLAAEFPASSHIRAEGLGRNPDHDIWLHARDHGFALVSKDDDFRQLSILHGAPPPVVWLSVGNSGTDAIANLLRAGRQRIEDLATTPGESLLILELR